MSNTALLVELIDELHEANCRLVEAARPLDRVSELSLRQRAQLGDQFRAALRVWESMTQRIGHVLAQNDLAAEEARS